MTESAEKISLNQKKYIDSQVNLFDVILAKVEQTFEFENYDNIVRTAQVIYAGYALTDIEDAVRALEK